MQHGIDIEMSLLTTHCNTLQHTATHYVDIEISLFTHMSESCDTAVDTYESIEISHTLPYGIVATCGDISIDYGSIEISIDPLRGIPPAWDEDVAHSQ